MMYVKMPPGVGHCIFKWFCFKTVFLGQYIVTDETAGLSATYKNAGKLEQDIFCLFFV